MSIQVKNLFYTYLPKTQQETLALKNVSLTIEDHSFVGIVGETGSGKSTLIQTFNALILPSQGEVIVDDFVVGQKMKHVNVKALRKHVGVVFQFPEYQLFEDTVEKDVAFGLKNFGHKEPEAIEKAHEAILSVGLDESYFKRSPFELSGGEKRRVAIAGILAIDPDILVLDEPTAGLDPQGSEVIMSLVNKLYEQGKTIIMVTHDMEVVMKYCQKVFVLHKGELAFEGAPQELFISLKDEYAIEIPHLYLLARSLKERDFKIDLNAIHTVSDLVKQIKENYHG